MAKEKVTTTWKKLSSKRGTIITYNCSAYITSSVDMPMQDTTGAIIRPQTNKSFYITNENEFIWIRSDVTCDVEVVNFI